MKTVLITGANRGIGRSMVEAFAYASYDIWACSRVERPSFLEDMADLSKRSGSLITPLFFDVCKEEEIKKAVKKVLAEKKGIDVLINNAGVAHNGLINMTSASKMREIFECNFFAPFMLMQLVSRKMMKQKHGCIINMCSVGGIEANPGYAAYGSSKAALIWLTRCAAKELAEYNIRVNGIAPGLIDTDMGHYKSDEELNNVYKRMTIRRMGRPEEIARAAVFLASEENSFINGQILIVDGGRCI